MGKVTIQEWIDALLSGKYKQGTGRLRTSDDGYCCLGVLCDLADPDQWRDDPDGMSWGQYRECHYAPEPILPDGITSTISRSILAPANDDGLGFEGIAELLTAVQAGATQSELRDLRTKQVRAKLGN